MKSVMTKANGRVAKCAEKNTSVNSEKGLADVPFCGRIKLT